MDLITKIKRKWDRLNYKGKIFVCAIPTLVILGLIFN